MAPSLSHNWLAPLRSTTTLRRYLASSLPGLLGGIPLGYWFCSIKGHRSRGPKSTENLVIATAADPQGETGTDRSSVISQRRKHNLLFAL